MTLANYVTKRNPLLVFLGIRYQLDCEHLNVQVFERDRYCVFYVSWKLLWANDECQGKTYQAVNKRYTISVSFLPSGKTQWFSDGLSVFVTALLSLASWEKRPTAGSAPRGGEGVLEEPQILVLCLCVWNKTNPYVLSGDGDGDVRFPLLVPDQVPVLALWVPPCGFRKFHICELLEHLE